MSANPIELMKDLLAKRKELNEETFFEQIKEIMSIENSMDILKTAEKNDDFASVLRETPLSFFLEELLVKLFESFKGTVEDKVNGSEINFPKNFKISAYDKLMGFIFYLQALCLEDASEKDRRLTALAEKYHSYHAALYIINSKFEKTDTAKRIDLIEWFSQHTWQNGPVAYEEIANQFAKMADPDNKDYDRHIMRMRMYHLIANKATSLSDNSVNDEVSFKQGYNPSLFNIYQKTRPFLDQELLFMNNEIDKYAKHLHQISSQQRHCLGFGL